MFTAVNTVEPPILDLVATKLLVGDKERMPLVMDRVPARLKQLFPRLGNAEWLNGAFSAGDLVMVSVLLRLRSSGILDEFLNLAAYAVGGKTRPAINMPSRRSWLFILGHTLILHAHDYLFQVITNYVLTLHSVLSAAQPVAMLCPLQGGYFMDDTNNNSGKPDTFLGGFFDESNTAEKPPGAGQLTHQIDYEAWSPGGPIAPAGQASMPKRHGHLTVLRF